MSKRSTKKPPRRRDKDPFAAREAARYESPIASREHIQQLLTDHGQPMWQEGIAEALGINDEDGQEALRRRLRAMVRDGQLLCNRRDGYAPVSKLDLIRGRIVGHKDGFGFLIPENGGEDLFLSPREMRTVLHGDRVVARESGRDVRGRKEGQIVEVLERNTQRVVGRYYVEGGVGVVVPDNARIHLDIMIAPDKQGGARHGQIVTADIVEQPTGRSPPIGQIVEVLGDHLDPGMEIDIAIRSHNVPVQWPATVDKEIAGLRPEVPEDAKREREDIRALPLVTIDGVDARDFDDAVYCERKGKGWRLVVAIADVSHYVHRGTALDGEAHTRGNSVYFPERVVPMLPEVLSNGLCSLNPKVDRLCMCCELSINDAGTITRSRFFEGVMCSHARLTYDQVAAILIDKDRKLREQLKPLVPHLEELHALYGVLRQGREARGTIDFDTTETRIEFGADRKIERIVPVIRNDAHRLIEECMIAANVAAARFLAKQKMPTLYRVHEGPSLEKLLAVREFLKELGLSLRGGDKPEAGHYAELLAKIQGRPDAHLIQTVLLRSLAQARYSPENVGHFGLAHDQYLHFTSPIRRYPDLLVHRAIRHVLRGGSVADFRYGFADMQALGEHCSGTERRADEATRDAVNWLKCEYIQDKVGETYDGIISAVTGFGIFVELADIFVEGLVHVTALHNDFYHFDPARHRLTGERTHTMYRLGDRVRVKVVRVDLDERKIDFELAEQGVVAKRKRETGTERKVRRGPGGRKTKRSRR